MVGPKKKKRKQSGSLSGTAPEVEVEVDNMSTSERMASMEALIQDLQKDIDATKADLKAGLQKGDLQKDIDAMKADLKKLKPVRKQFVRDRGLSLINEFIAFISQIHGTGVQWKYQKGYNTENADFKANCEEFLSSDQVDPSSPSLKSTSDVCALFNLCNTRNSMMHYEEPEDCILEVKKFVRKHGDLLHKCSKEVQFCVPRIEAMARHFVGPYRLKRLACQCIGRFLVSKGLSWKNLTKLDTVLDGNLNLIKQSKPQGTRSKHYKSQIMTLFASSKVNGPKWTGASKDEGEDYLGIQAAFGKCAGLDMLPPRASYALEYGLLEHAWA